jgi:superfamily II DNA/RNA helicase
VKRLAEDFLKEYIQVNIGALQLSANHDILQIVDVCSEMDKAHKVNELLDVICQAKQHKTIIFTETKRKCDEIARRMCREGRQASCIHGDKSQQDRDWVLREFRNGRAQILVATDVAARGLDVDDVKFVINFDYPNNSEDYVHRIGRTARAGSTGTAYTFFTHSNANKAKDLVEVLKEARQQINPKLAQMAERSSYGNRNSYGGRSRWGSSGGGGRGQWQSNNHYRS